MVGPLKVVAVSDGWRVSLPASDDLVPDLPVDLDRTLSDGFSELLKKSHAARVTLDLKSLPAISSHQLGLMLAVQKALREKMNRLPVVGVSESVRKLLEMTNTAQFFDISL
jgi:anti-anti-sigma factor